MPILEAKALSKGYPVAIKQAGLKGTLGHFFRRQYRLVEAVRQISLKIAPGEMVGFLGSNGAGKTTTLKMFAGLIHPSSGTVRVAGHIPFHREPAFLRKITLVIGQKQQLLWDLPALDSLKINGAVYGLREVEFQRRVGELVEMLGFEGKLTQPVRKLSLGERMKAELIAALLHRPKILFLDEPTLGLDVNAQSSVRAFLQEYNHRYQATILLTSHYMADITALCQRVLLIHAGSLIYDGLLENLVEQFAPYREVKVELARPYPRSSLLTYGELESLDGQSARFLVQRPLLTRAIAQMLAELEIQDLMVTDPPVEEVIGRVFQMGAVA